jgi:predicted mannosyl-3-phosphoglycerate phosphatase (HAD superfamily)
MLTLHLADRFRLTLYDAVYLELAQRRNHLPRSIRSLARRRALSAQVSWGRNDYRDHQLL